MLSEKILFSKKQYGFFTILADPPPPGFAKDHKKYGFFFRNPSLSHMVMIMMMMMVIVRVMVISLMMIVCKDAPSIKEKLIKITVRLDARVNKKPVLFWPTT